MQNLVFLIGRLTGDPKMDKTENGKPYSLINVSVDRAFKNSAGIYENDFITCKLWGPIAETACDYCKKGDLIGIKARLQTYKNKDGESRLELVAERITFLSSKKSINDDVEPTKEMEI